MNRERLRLGAFGVGRMGQVHLEHLIALHQAGEIELVAIGDRFGPTLSSASRLLNVLGGPDLARIARFDSPTPWRPQRSSTVWLWLTDRRPRARQLAFPRRPPVLVENRWPTRCRSCRVLPWGLPGGACSRLPAPLDAASRPARGWVLGGRIGRSTVASRAAGQEPDAARLSEPRHYGRHGDPSGLRGPRVHHSSSPASRRCTSPPRTTGSRWRGRQRGPRVLHWPDGTVAHLWGSRINAPAMTTASSSSAPRGGSTWANSSATSGPSRHGCGAAPATIAAGSKRREFPMTRPSARHPDFYPRYTAAYAAEVSAFVDCLRRKAPFNLGPDLG